MDNLNFNVVTKNGKKIDCEILAIYETDDERQYICYTDNVLENGEKRMFVSKYEIDNDDMIIYPIEDQEEWKWVIDNLYKKSEGDNE